MSYQKTQGLAPRSTRLERPNLTSGQQRVTRREHIGRGGPTPTLPRNRNPHRKAGPLFLLALALAVVAAVVIAVRHRHASAVPPTPPATPPAVEAGLLPWGLSAPLSREVVLAGNGGALTILGGLTSGGVSASGIYTLDTSTGRLLHLGDLPAPAHDGAGARIGSRLFYIGGGASTTVGSVEMVPLGSGTPSIVGRLPQPRADGAAVTIADTAYLVGGYNGSRLDPEVLATSDGALFRAIAQLAVPVRYPAVAVLGGKIYVFGGLGASGPTNAVQMVDPASGTTKVIARLPTALAGAVAADVGGTIYVAGGQTASGNGAPDSTAILAFQPGTGTFLPAGTLQAGVSFASAAVQGGRLWIVGGESAGKPLTEVQVLVPNRSFGSAGAAGAGSPFFGGKLLVADRGANRLLLLNDENTIVWRYPSASSPPPPGGFYFPDDAFFVRGGSAIITNQEQNNTIDLIAFPSGNVVWSYGHPGTTGSAPGYLNEPDDAYLLPDGQVSVADAYNCRILFIRSDKSIAGQIGTPGQCYHSPPTRLGAPNGDTPLANGNVLVAETKGSWISSYTPKGDLSWSVHLPIIYPSDPQQIGPDRYLVADYTRPGAIVVFDQTGRILYEYRPRHGSGVLDHPSLAALLPSGVFMVNDDYNDRMVAIDPATGALVWQYGATGRPGTSGALLSKPDGFDLLLPNGATPLHL